jgi:uncharacterized protein
VTVGPRDFVFVDGGMTMYNNPAFHLFPMATLDEYRLAWAATESDLLLVSAGTGMSPKADDHLRPGDMDLLFNISSMPAALIYAALNEQDLLCRVFGDCRAGEALDREVGDLVASDGPLQRGQKLFTYLRYNAHLTREGLDALGCRDIEPKTVQQMDSIEGIPELRRVGARVAETKVLERHFEGFSPS